MIAALLLALVAPADDEVTIKSYRWAPFISPMGEPFLAKAVGEDTLAAWFTQADRNRDGRLTENEMKADADRFFALLDLDGDGGLDPTEIVNYETEVAPDVQVGKKRRPKPGETLSKERDRTPGPGGLQGAARYALLNMPQPVAAADTDFNRLVTRAEFAAAAATRFRLLDTLSAGALTLAQLQGRLADAQAKKKPDRKDKDARDARVANPFPIPGN